MANISTFHTKRSIKTLTAPGGPLAIGPMTQVTPSPLILLLLLLLVFVYDRVERRGTESSLTPSTDQMILILEGLLASGGQVSATDFAKRYSLAISLPVSPSPRLPVSPSPRLPVSPSPRLPVSPSPRLPVSPSPRLPVSPSPRLPLSLSPSH